MTTLSKAEIADLHKEERSAMRGTVVQFSLLLIAPLAALFALAGVLLYKETAGLAKIDRFKAVAAAKAETSRTIAALQRERGRSAGFLGSGGAQFRDQLAEQRRETDERLAGALTILAGARSPDLSDEIAARLASDLATFQERVGGLAALRARVDALDVSAPEMAAHYTTAINALLDFNSLQSVAAAGADPNAAASAKHLLALAQEYAGLERAAGAQGFAEPVFAANHFVAMQRLIAQQEALLRQFRAIAPKVVTLRLDQALNAPAAQAVTAHRTAAAVSVRGAPHTLSAEQWFQDTTDRITELTGVQEALAQHVADLTAKTEADLTSEMLLTVAVALLTLAVSTGVMLWRTYAIAVALRGLSRSVQRMSRGLTDIWIKGADRSDMVGLLARSMKRVTRQGEENTQVRSALSVSKSQIMITDVKEHILFVNGSLEASAEESMDYFFEVIPDFDPFSMYVHLLGLVKEALQADGHALSGLDVAHEVDVCYADRTFEVTITPVKDVEERPAGHAIEWREVTATRAIEEQVGELIAATRQGDFSGQITISTNQKFLVDVAEGVNAISSQVASFMAELKEALEAMADGDLTRRVDQRYAGDLAVVAEATNTTIDRLRAMVGKITAGGVAIETQSTDIREGALQLATKSEEAAAALEETAAAMEEISSSVKATASFASDAKETANAARDSAAQGGEVVTQTVGAMRRIQDSSKEIVSVLGVIDGIAFQTNLLALNAAVEAARAGDAGKGFAVVAAEVRALAQNSGDAAQTVKDLIAASTRNVDDGVRLVEATGDALQAIREAVENTNQKIAEISRSAQDQSVGVQEIATTVSLLDDMTQENAKVAEQNASASRLMATQSIDLADLVKQFRTDENAAPVGAADVDALSWDAPTAEGDGSGAVTPPSDGDQEHTAA